MIEYIAMLCFISSSLQPKPNHPISPAATMKPNKTWTLTCCSSLYPLIIFVIMLFSLLDFRTNIFHIQRNELRSLLINFHSVLEANHINQLPMKGSHIKKYFDETPLYFMDFGGLLGVIRDKDIIWSEVDLDVGLNVAMQRILKENSNNILQQFKERGIVKLESRDEYKYRLYNSWGFHFDFDVWDLKAKNDKLANSPCNQHSQSDLCLTMVTGRDDRGWETYTLPLEWYLPLKYIDLPKNIDYVGYSLQHKNPKIAVPNQPEKVLTYWYDTWDKPADYDKGKDENPTHSYEYYLKRQLTIVFNIAWAVILLFRSIHWGLNYHQTLVIISLILFLTVIFINIFRLSPAAMNVILRRYHFRSPSRCNAALVHIALSCLGTSLLVHFGLLSVPASMFTYLFFVAAASTATQFYLIYYKPSTIINHLHSSAADTHSSTPGNESDLEALINKQ
jgi:hypothetical protein